jgi:uncharacterized protein DUF1573
MRIVFAVIVLGLINLGLASCDGQSEKQEGLISTDVINNPSSGEGEVSFDELPKMEFVKTTHDFGKVIEGEIVTFSFKFKNTGKSDLVISRVSTSCGCTASEYPEQAIKAGKEGIVKISFDSDNRKGFQSKTATILANTQPNKTSLRIKAMVINPEKDNF